MKRILVFSDSHGECDNMIKVTENIIGVDLIVHCGDYSRDAVFMRKAFPDTDVVSVRGNNEFGLGFDELWETIEVDGVRIFITHGHIQGVKSGLDTLIERCKKENCSVGIFGHTHRSLCEKQDGVLLLNPGSIRGRMGTYGVIEIEEGKPKGAVISI